MQVARVAPAPAGESDRAAESQRASRRLYLPTIVIAGLAALVLLITRHLLVVLGAAALMAGTIVGFVLARTVGIFGFHLTFSSGLAWTVLIVEGAGVVMLLLTAALLWRRR
jgi:hypothetical protein